MLWFEPSVIPLAVLLSAATSTSAPSVTLTQVNAVGEEIGRSHPAVCDLSACHVTLPVAFYQAVCLVSGRISLPDLGSHIMVSFSLGGCKPSGVGGNTFVLDTVDPLFAKLDPQQAVTQIVQLHIGLALHDLVRRAEPPSFVRVDAIFPGREQR
jgi:hypothetical protein